MTLPDIIDSVRPCVVQITFTVFDLPEDERRRLGVNTVLSRPLGTGFFVNDEAYVVTAQHVVEAMRGLDAKYPLGTVNVGIGLAYENTESLRSNFNVIGFDLVAEDMRHDLALLRMNPFEGGAGGGIIVGDKPLQPLYGVPAFRTERPRDGDGIAVSGYPLGESVLVTNNGVVASSWGVAVEQVAHPTVLGMTFPQVRDVYLGDVQSNWGNSGGPVYSSDDGAVVGVLVAGRLTGVTIGGGPAIIGGLPLQADAGLSIIVPIKYACEMLEQHNVRWTASP